MCRSLALEHIVIMTATFIGVAQISKFMKSSLVSVKELWSLNFHSWSCEFEKK